MWKIYNLVFHVDLNSLQDPFAFILYLIFQLFVSNLFNWFLTIHQNFIEIDPKYFRPAEVEQLQGDASKANKQLGWKPKVEVEELARMMVESDFEMARREKTLRDAGHNLPSGMGHDQWEF